MRFLLLLALLITIDEGAGIDPHGATYADVGCAIDPNGCPRGTTLGDSGPIMDPNG